ncbi:hypothetical protein PC128_g19824 [Phytophthora cactorum]|nr:hypothetical protein PC128_g19824 [Phytophthora cactorum]
MGLAISYYDFKRTSGKQDPAKSELHRIELVDSSAGDVSLLEGPPVDESSDFDSSEAIVEEATV